jgi:endoglucanase
LRYRRTLLPALALSCLAVAACGNSSNSVKTSDNSNGGGTGTGSGGGTGTSSTGNAMAIAVEGNHFVDQNGDTLQLLGVSISGLEQGATALNTSGGDYQAATDPGFALMASWNINLVRIPLNEDTWLGINSCTTDGGTSATLQSNVKQIVANANAHGIYVILDLHWSAPNAFGCPVGQASMPDSDNSVAFWTSIAGTFKDNPAVMFEMFNEPFAYNNYNNAIEPINGAVPSGQSATDLSILQNGGSYDGGFWYQCNGGGKPCPSGEGSGSEYLDSSITPFTTAGMQEMLNAIRATGAKNVVISNSMWWAGEIETWLSSQPTDSAGQLAAGWHEDGGGSATTVAASAVQTAGFPVIITEAYATNSTAVLDTTDKAGNNYFNWAMGSKAGFSFWAWVPWSGGLITPNADNTAFGPSALGQTLITAYCSQPIVNPAASCSAD